MFTFHVAFQDWNKWKLEKILINQLHYIEWLPKEFYCLFVFCFIIITLSLRSKKTTHAWESALTERKEKKISFAYYQIRSLVCTLEDHVTLIYLHFVTWSYLNFEEFVAWGCRYNPKSIATNSNPDTGWYWKSCVILKINTCINKSPGWKCHI